MRIASVVHNSVTHDARVLKEAATLSAAGHEVMIFGLTPDEAEDLTLPNGVRVHLAHRDLSMIRDRIREEGLEQKKENSVLMSFRIQGETVLSAVRERFDPDAVHIHDHVLLTAAGGYKAAFGCPIVWDAHEIYEDLAGIEDVRRVVNPRIIAENTRHIDGFVTLNRSIADFYAQRYLDLPEAVLLPNAVERVTLEPYDGRLHEAAGLRSDQRILLFQGGFSPYRGIPALLEAAMHLTGHWSLVLMGWGKLEAQIAEAIEAAAARGDREAGRARIATVPRAVHDELLSWTAGASLGAIPYEDTGLNHRFCSPNKLWEYPGAGVPILASDMPEMARKIDEYRVGITVPRSLEPHAIAEAVNALSEDDLQAMREACGRFAAAESWQNYEKRLLQLYASLGSGVGERPEEGSASLSAGSGPRRWWDRLRHRRGDQ